MIDAILTNTVLPRISLEYLKRLSSGEAIKAVDAGGQATATSSYAFD